LIIKKLKVDDKTFPFDPQKTLITSKVNSVGKTSLLRMLLYSLGYKIPSTKGLNFNKMYFITEININKIDYEFFRHNDNLKINNITNKSSDVFSVKAQQIEILSILYTTDSLEILKNILGTHYFDQEKGWTLLNRGLVIGKIRFNIEELLTGFNSKELADTNNHLKNLIKEKNDYLKIKPLLELNRGFDPSTVTDRDIDIDVLHDRLRSNNIEIRKTKNRISQYKQVKNDNQHFIDLIDNLAIRIKTKTGIQVIKKNDIVGFNENQELILAQISRLNRYLNQLNDIKFNLNKKINSSVSLVKLDSQLDHFKASIHKLNITPESIELIIKNYNAEINHTKEQIKKSLYNLKVTERIFFRVKKYASILGVEDMLDNNTTFLFTNNLKRYSGAKLHLLVFAYRLALLKEIQNTTGECIPLVIDSPMAGELDEDNLSKMFQLLNTEFSNNQIIIASIFDINKITPINKIITLDKGVLK